MTVTNFFRNSFQLLLIVLTVAFPVRLYAQDITTTDLSSAFFRMGEGLGFAGAYRAISDSSQAIIYNPAGLAKKKGIIEFTGDYAHFEDLDSHAYGVSVSDYQTSQSVAYGLAFHRYSPTIGGVTGNVNQTMIGFGYSLGSLLQFGVSGKGYWVNLDSPILQGPRGVDMDVGAIFRPLSILSFGAVGYNLIRGNTVEEFPRSLGFGSALLFDPHAKLSFDFVKNFNTPNPKTTNYHFGAEFRAAESVYLRGGYAVDSINQNNYYSAGIAFMGPAADLLFTFSQRLSPVSETYAVSASFKM